MASFSLPPPVCLQRDKDEARERERERERECERVEGSTETARERGVVRKRARDMEEGGWGLGKGGERDGERETERRG